jgi:hypothetical protein
VRHEPDPGAATQSGSAGTRRGAPGPTDVRSLALTVLAVIASIVILQYAQVVIIPIVLGILISHALEPWSPASSAGRSCGRSPLRLY